MRLSTTGSLLPPPHDSSQNPFKEGTAQPLECRYVEMRIANREFRFPPL